MLTNNNVILCGLVMPGRYQPYMNASGHKMMVFNLRTAEVWGARTQESLHYEYHRILLKDAGSYKMLSKYESLITAGNKLLVQGRLRYRLSTENKVQHRYAEIEAGSIDLLAITEQQDVLIQDQLPADYKTVVETNAASVSKEDCKVHENCTFAEKAVVNKGTEKMVNKTAAGALAG